MQHNISEARGDRLVRRAQWSAIVGIGALLLSAALGGCRFVFESNWLSELSSPAWNALACGYLILAAMAGSAGLAAAAFAWGGGSRDNTSNRSLAFTGMILGVLAMTGTCLILLDSHSFLIPFLFTAF